MPTASSAARRDKEQAGGPAANRRVAGKPTGGRPAPKGRARSRKRRASVSKKGTGVAASHRNAPRSRGTAARKTTARSTGMAVARRPAADAARKQQGKSAKTVKSSRRAKPQKARAPLPQSAVASTDPAYFVLVPTVALLLLGLVMVFSAGSIIGMGQSVGGYRYFLMQLAWAVLGIALMVFFWKFDYHKMGKISGLGVILSIALLGMVLFRGTSAFGARRWLNVGPISIQPTEIAKFTLVIFAAFVLATKGQKLKKPFHLFVPVILVMLVEAALILRQPDMGSTMVICLSIMVLLVVAQTKLSHLLAIGGVGAFVALFFALSAPYRRERLFSFVNPWNSPRGAGYQVIQSYIALGSGHIKGLGLGMSRQKFLYLPNAHTDFIFAIIGEELGLLGTMAVLSLIGILAYGGVRIASAAPDELGKLLAIGITGLIVIQGLVNMGGVTGLLPITGVPLPLVSSGGSSLCVCLGCVGILLNIAAQSHR